MASFDWSVLFLGLVVGQVQDHLALLARGVGQQILSLRPILDEAALLEQGDDHLSFGQRELRDLAQVGEADAALLIAEDLERAENLLHFLDGPGTCR